MKKYLAILLALVLCLSLGVTAFAADDEAPSVKPADVTVTKTYELTGGESAPVETLTFTVVPDDNNLGGVEGDVVIGTNNSLTTDGTASIEFKISFPTYTKVGVYKYTITEVAPNPKTAGVTYDTDPLVVVVTVTNKNSGTATTDELEATVAVHKGNEEGDKEAEFVNAFGMGKLTVTKTVSGNLASNTKKFLIHVTFTSETPVGSPITYTVAGGEDKETVSFEGTTGTADIELSHGQSAVFTDIPAGVSYAVAEDSQHTVGADSPETTEEGYTVSYKNEKGEIKAKDEITCTVTNEKSTEVDTGVILDSLPYVLVVAVILSAAVLMFVNKRRSEV